MEKPVVLDNFVSRREGQLLSEKIQQSNTWEKISSMSLLSGGINIIAAKTPESKYMVIIYDNILNLVNTKEIDTVQEALDCYHEVVKIYFTYYKKCVQ